MLKSIEAMKDKVPKIEQPQHRVVLTKPFLMGATEVTIAEFRRFADATGFKSDAERFGFGEASGKELNDSNLAMRGWSWRTPRQPATEDSPAEQISWNDACAYCNWLSGEEHRQPWYESDGKDGWVVAAQADGYRLPTEAEWEYACRAGTTTIFSFGDDDARLNEFAWDLEAHVNRAQPVGRKQPNAFGLSDMHGNLSEWCQDFYEESWYAKTTTDDPRGPLTGTSGRSIRGSSFTGSHGSRGSAFRWWNGPTFRAGYLGFRVVQTLTPQTPPAVAPFDAK